MLLPPPWTLRGEAIVLLQWRGVLALVQYHDSPVGPYDEVAQIVWTRDGWHVAVMAVTSAESVTAGRANWGYPKVQAALNWQRQRNRITFADNTQQRRFRLWGMSIPIMVRTASVQQLGGMTVKVPLRVEGRARLAFHGRRWGIALEAMTLTVDHPIPLT